MTSANRKQPETKNSQWKAHLGDWAKYTAAAGAALTMATGADAGIVSGTPNVTINLANLNSVPNGTHASAGFGLTGARAGVNEQTFFNGASGDRRGAAYIAGINILGVHVNNGQLADDGNHEAALNFATGQAISGSHLGNFATLWRGTTRSGRSHPIAHVGNFNLGVSGLGATGIVGFTINSGDLGWIKVKIGDRNNDGYVDELKILSWAYNQTPGAAITAGDSGTSVSDTPEPDTAALGVLAAGAAGILALRRRRKQVHSS